MAESIRVDEEVRLEAIEPGDSFIIQAPAGSGKTSLLTNRFLRLLAIVERPEEILAITFTRKAAAEMRDRILAALRAVGTPDPARPIHVRTLELARTALAADTRHDWHLLEQPGRLRIQTIDALNLGLARRLPLLSGLGAGLGIEEDARGFLVLEVGHGGPEEVRGSAVGADQVEDRGLGEGSRQSRTFRF